MALIESEYHKQIRQNQHERLVPFIHVKEVCKSFDFNGNNHNNANPAQYSTHDVLNGLELKIEEGQFVTIVGPSGCGKSTLLNIIAGIDKPDSGNIFIKGADDISSTKRIVIFQEGALFPWLTVQENVEFGLRVANIPREERLKIATKYIEMVGLEAFSESFVHQLSGGMKQRVAIARALAIEPEILLMDEPFAALDVQTRDSLHEELVGIHKTTGKTIIFVTHNINEAILLGDKVIVFSAAMKTIRREFVISLPRPRDAESPEFHEIKREVLNEFELDLQTQKQREVRNAP